MGIVERRRRERDERRGEILAAARRLFWRHRFAGTTMPDVAHAAEAVPAPGYNRVVVGAKRVQPARGAVDLPSRKVVAVEGRAKAIGLLASCRRRALGFASILALLLVMCPVPSPARPRPGGDPQQDGLRYPVDVRAVALDVVVTDRGGRFVSGLKREDFRVLEDGAPQELSFFTAGRTPVTMVVLLDSSASVRSNVEPVQKAANRFIESLEREDRALVGFFHESVVFGPRFTSDMKEHSALIKRMRTQRSTHLYDALVESFEKLAPVPRRKALLVFSDGEDQGSRASVDDVLDAARRSHVSVYAVGLVGWSAGGGMHTNQELLQQIAQLTGGRALFPESEKEMRKAFDRIRAELHHQYRMGYVPQEGEGRPGQWREIQVELPRRDSLIVRCRLGYHSDGQAAP